MRAIIALAALVFYAGPGFACDGQPVCTVIDPTGTPLNVRDGPNGKILTTLKKGAIVDVVRHEDHEGNRWALVSRYAESWGFIFGDYVKCESSDEIGKICIIADPTGTPLNIREEPNGKILGTWPNGVRVRPYAETMHNGKLWYEVDRVADDNAIGWVFDPYLKCEEGG